MYFSDVLAALRRRWKLLLVLVVLVLGACGYLFTVVKPAYSMEASVVLVPPKTPDPNSVNRYMELGNIGGAVDVLARSMGSAANVEALKPVAPDAEYIVARDPATSAPVLMITSTSKDPAQARTLLQAVIDRTTAQLVDLQDEIKIGENERITAVTLSVDDKPDPDQKGRIRILGVAFVGLMGASVLFVALLDGLLVRRRRRREAAAAAGPDAASSDDHPDPDRREGGRSHRAESLTR